MSKTIYNFNRYSDTQLDTEAENVFTKMDGNASFPTPDPVLTVLETVLGEYRVALVEAAHNDQQKVVVKNQKRAQLENTLRSLALYVEKVAGKDEAVILSAGFRLRKKGTGSAVIPTPEAFRVTYGYPGSGIAELRVKYLHLALQYRFDYRLVGEEQWSTVYSSSSRVTVNGLESFKDYEFRAAYIGRGVNPAPRFGETLTSIVL